MSIYPNANGPNTADKPLYVNCCVIQWSPWTAEVLRGALGVESSVDAHTDQASIRKLLEAKVLSLIVDCKGIKSNVSKREENRQTNHQ